MAQATGKRTPPMPLGDAWSGVCRAAPSGEWQPDPNTLQQHCNFGYAQSQKCARVPADATRRRALSVFPTTATAL
jgi:hypothetical protein